jgi:hypothetical protein
MPLVEIYLCLNFRIFEKSNALAFLVGLFKKSSFSESCRLLTHQCNLANTQVLFKTLM